MENLTVKQEEKKGKRKAAIPGLGNTSEGEKR